MATVFGVAVYGVDTYGPAMQGQVLPPCSHVIDKREQPVTLQRPIERPPVTLPREQWISPHREGSAG